MEGSKECTLSGMGSPGTDPVIAFESQAAWEAWLAEHHATATGVWVKMAKKATGIPSVTHQEALDVALCYGWIDGQRNRFDDQWFLQRFTPRRARSNWSKINRDKVERLIEEGRMQPAGLREVDRARADGRWDAAYDAQRFAEVPDDSRGRSTPTRRRPPAGGGAAMVTAAISSLTTVRHRPPGKPVCSVTVSMR